VRQNEGMTFSATAILVLIASPGDTADERAAIQLQLSKWNVSRGERENVVAVPWLYEQHSIPVLGEHPQSVINAQAVDRADVVVAFFDSRLGTETPEAVSGTAEEIRRAHAAGKPVHVYFSKEDIPRSAEPEQLVKLAEFKKVMESEGLLGEYNSPENLANQVSNAIDYDVSTQNWSSMTSRNVGNRGAILEARHDHQREQNGVDNKGKPRYRTTANHLVIRNGGDATASDVHVTVEEIDGQFIFEEPAPFDLTRNSELQFGLMALHSGNAKVNMTWTEDGESRSAAQSILVR
jgi:nucleoside 2-deoxyribosyltransferase